MGAINDYDVHVRFKLFSHVKNDGSQDQELVRAVRRPEQQAELPGGGQHQPQQHHHHSYHKYKYKASLRRSEI